MITRGVFKLRVLFTGRPFEPDLDHTSEGK
jgi:hypothetical protein